MFLGYVGGFFGFPLEGKVLFFIEGDSWEHFVVVFLIARVRFQSIFLSIVAVAFGWIRSILAQAFWLKAVSVSNRRGQVVCRSI